MIERLEDRITGPLIRRQIESLALPITKVQGIAQVINFHPFSSLKGEDPKPNVICDLDGVVLSPRNGTLEHNRKQLLGLRNLTRRSEKIVFTSARINLGLEKGSKWKVTKTIFGRGSFPNFPFLTDESIARLTSFVRAANPSCKVDVQTGIKKLTHLNLMTQDELDILRQDKDLVIIGSGYFDRQLVQRLIAQAWKEGVSLDKLRVFDTGHLVL